jgi:hypothetical protein
VPRFNLRAVGLIACLSCAIGAGPAQAGYQPTDVQLTQVAQFLAHGGAAPATAGMDCDAGCRGLVAAEAALPNNSRGGLIRRGLAALRTRVGELPKARLLTGLGLSFITGWRIGSGINSKFLRLGATSEENAERLSPTAHFCEAGCALSRGVWVGSGQWYIVWYFQSSAAHGYQDTYVEEGPDGCPVSIRPPTPPWPFVPRAGGSVGCLKNPGEWPPLYGDNVGLGYSTTSESDILQGGKFVPWTDQPYDIWSRSWDGAPADEDDLVQQTPGALDGASGIDEQLARDFIYSRFSDTVDDPQETLRRTAEILASDETEQVGAPATEIVRDCTVPLWHYTSAANASLIYLERTLTASREDPPHPAGAFATTITPLDPGWTQRRLALHLFAEVKPADAWILICWDVGANRRFRPEGTEPDYWYSPGAAGSEVPIEPAAWGRNRMVDG